MDDSKQYPNPNPQNIDIASENTKDTAGGANVPDASNIPGGPEGVGENNMNTAAFIAEERDEIQNPEENKRAAEQELLEQENMSQAIEKLESPTPESMKEAEEEQKQGGE